MLGDGGMNSAFDKQVQPCLGQMAEANEVLDLVHVSRINQHHIPDVLKLIHHTMVWRVHDYRKSEGLSARVP